MRFKNILGKSGRANIDSIQSDFVSLASHQLRTPLSAIKWYTEILMAQKQGKLSNRQIEYLKEIYRSNDRAISLVNDLLDVSRIQEGSINLELRPIRAEDVIEEVIDGLDTLTRTSGVGIDFQILSGPLPKIETDRDKLKRILLNLVSNAVKYSPRDGKVKIVLEKKGRNLQISISDSGVGIPAVDQGKIFKKFFRSNNVLKLIPDGTGLGLFISKALVEAMGGKIGFSSTEGKGTTFYFVIPLLNAKRQSSRKN